MLGESAIIAITLASAVIAAAAQYFYKKSIKKFEFNSKGLKILISNRGIWIGGILYIVSLVVYLKALSSGALSFVYPTFASTFVFVAFISHFALKEKISRMRVLGLTLIVLGVVLVALTY